MSRQRFLKTASLFVILPQFLTWQQFKDLTLSSMKDQQKITIALSTQSAACKTFTRKFKVQLALTDASRTFGLSNRKKKLDSDEGMLFIFEYPRQASFWMKETLIPMQIGFMNGQGLITATEEMFVEPDPEHPKKIYKSPLQTEAALEAAPRALENAKGQILCFEK